MSLALLKQRVSANQFYFALYLSVLSTVFMYLSSPNIKVSQTDSILRPVVFCVLSIVSVIPSMIVVRKHRQLKKERKYIENTPFLKIIALIYGVVFFLSLVKTFARFDLFVSSELFPNADMTIFLACIVGVCVALSFLDIGALGRASVVFALVVVSSTALVMLSLSQELDFLNFTPLMENGFDKFLGEGTLFALQAMEIGLITVFSTQLEGNVEKGFVVWSVLSSVTFAAIFFFVVGVLGGFADTQLFPTYTAVSLASFGLLERVDALETAVWILCIVLKAALFSLAIIKSFHVSFPKLSRKITGTALFIVCSVLINFISSDIERFSFLSSDFLTVALFILSTIILPVCVILNMRRVKPVEKLQEDI